MHVEISPWLSSSKISDIFPYHFVLVSDKPPIEDLQYFLEFQISRVWAPEVSNLQGKDPVCQSLQFSLMGPKLYISPNQVTSLAAHILLLNQCYDYETEVLYSFISLGCQ